jgi:hypothetical protein
MYPVSDKHGSVESRFASEPTTATLKEMLDAALFFHNNRMEVDFLQGVIVSTMRFVFSKQSELTVVGQPHPAAHVRLHPRTEPDSP